MVHIALVATPYSTVLYRVVLQTTPLWLVPCSASIYCAVLHDRVQYLDFPVSTTHLAHAVVHLHQRVRRLLHCSVVYARL
jgi:hypothetical protein